MLKEKISEGRGLHANSDYRECADCHVDHLGRNYEMIYWGKEGMVSFDHRKTGYVLEGAHRKAECRQCHNETAIVDKKRLTEAGKDLNRTFLGLRRDCISCHQDEHRGQLSGDCLRCHTMETWQKPPGFDHDNTGFRLTGRHREVKCQQCHKIIKDNKYTDNLTYFDFAIKKFATCTDCHADVHNNRFGGNCTQCHNTGGWANYNKNSFDHSKTRYPLRGRHTSLRCEQCHLPGRPMKISNYQKCMDCHDDAHRWQFLNRPQKGACEECHSVEGFSPSLFTMEMHQECAYPLQGAHLAVPCLECHKQRVVSTRGQTPNFRFENTRCVSCHEDVHQGQVSSVTSKEGCEGCHIVESWHRVDYDHTNTTFRLEGRHLQTGCVSCHIRENPSGGQSWRFKNITGACFNCHNDIHQGQFSRENQPADCGRCHSAVDWLADRFDHEKDSFFSLKGAHKYVACVKCHKKEIRNGQQVTIYRPLDRRCESCHKG